MKTWTQLQQAAKHLKRVTGGTLSDGSGGDDDKPELVKRAKTGGAQPAPSTKGNSGAKGRSASTKADQRINTPTKPPSGRRGLPSASPDASAGSRSAKKNSVVDLSAGGGDEDDKDDDNDDIDFKYMQWGGSQKSKIAGVRCSI